MDNKTHLFITNLKHLLKKHEISQRELARRLNCSHQHINAILNGRAYPSMEIIQKIADMFDIGMDDILSSKAYSNEPPSDYGRDPVTWVPFMNTKMIDGKIFVRASASRAQFAFKTDWLYQMGNPERMAFVRTVGECLNGELPDNAIVLIDQDQKAIANGAPYYVRINQELYIKRLTRQDGIVFAHSGRDPEHGAAQLDENNDWEILGRCLWYSKSLI
jgi:DNA-binding XRE family transcriptional regulator